jgi:hypothetical protein
LDAHRPAALRCCVSLSVHCAPFWKKVLPATTRAACCMESIFCFASWAATAAGALGDRRPAADIPAAVETSKAFSCTAASGYVGVFHS